MTSAKSNRKKKTKEAPMKPKSPIEEVLGMTLLTSKGDKDEDFPRKPTKDLFEDKDFVLLYFSNNTCPPCEIFVPLLIDFYEKHKKTGKFEVVYVSSDRTLEDFDEKYGKMPWLAIPNDDDGYNVKHSLATSLKIQKIPILIVLEAKTGLFVTNQAHLKVRALADRDYETAAVAKVLDEWKAKEAVTLEEGAKDAQINSLLMTLLKNPGWIIGLYYLYKWLKLYLKANDDGSTEAGDSMDSAGGAEL
jgi:nucleoredoxin